VKISVIIPVLNEAPAITRLLKSIMPNLENAEVIVVDGGSTDATSQIAREAGATLVVTHPGRGRQIVCGVQYATGDVLLFLHADSLWPLRGLDAIRHALSTDSNAIGGNFCLLFDGKDRFSLWLNRFYAWIRARGFYYGDSGLFILRKEYDRLGGMRPIALMEDYDLVQRMEKSGRTLCIADSPLVTSSRRFERRRPTAIVSGWLIIHTLYHLGVSPDVLAWLYRSAAHR
jgi:rSAM/selenodomain-associated transferase 2